MYPRAAHVAALCLLVLGCSADPALPSDVADAGPEAVALSDGQLLQMVVYTTPDQPPTRGLSTVIMHVTDAKTGAPQDGLQVAALPWMPAHGHGTTIKTAIEAKGGGTYVISRVNMFMGGKWDLRLSFSGSVNDRAALHFEIP